MPRSHRPALLALAACVLTACGAGRPVSLTAAKAGPSGPAARKQVAVYVYAGLDEEEMAPYARRALQEMETVGSTDQMDVVVEVDDYRWPDAVYHLDPHPEAAPTDRIFHTPPLRVLPEVDSGRREELERFLVWATTTYPAEQAVVVVLGHSWGWRGLIQDFELPVGSAASESMIPIYDVRKAMETATQARGQPFDAVVLDACITGVAEVAYELKDVARTLMASQLETPLTSYPYDRALAKLGAGEDLGQTLKFWVRDFVTAYARSGGGRLTALERQHYPATVVALDLTRMDAFRSRLDALLADLEALHFRDDVLLGSDFRADFVDTDDDADVYDFLLHVEAALGREHPEVAARSRDVRALFGYPDDGAVESAKATLVPAAAGDRVELEIQADEAQDESQRLCNALAAFEFMNKRLGRYQRECEEKPDDTRYEGVYLDPPALVARDGRVYLRLTLAAEGVMSLRTRLPGAESVRFRVGDGPWQDERFGDDWDVRDAFAPGSLYLAEGHDFGAYNNHGLGIFLTPEIPDSDTHAATPDGRITKEKYYGLLRWAQESRWGRMMFGPLIAP